MVDVLVVDVEVVGGMVVVDVDGEIVVVVAADSVVVTTIAGGSVASDGGAPARDSTVVLHADAITASAPTSVLARVSATH